MHRQLLILLVCCLAAGERLPASAWIARVQAEAAAEELGWTGADAAIRLGAAWCIANHPGKRSYQGGTAAHPAADAFTGFWAARGQELLRRWRSGADLGGEARWLPVIEMAWASVARKDHRGGKDRRWDPSLSEADYQAAEADLRQLEKDAADLLRQLYAGPGITAAELARLRRFQRALWTRCVMGVDFRPDRLGLTVQSSQRRPLGVPVPELRATPIAAVLALPDYRDEPPGDLALLWPLRADGVVEILFALAAHHPGADGKAVPDPEWLRAQPAAVAQLPLAPHRPGRPTLLFLPDATDCFAPLAYPFLASLRHAYGGQADILAVNATIHDLHMSPRQFFAGPASPFTSHPLTLHERARTARNLAMAYPGVDVPWLLDDVGSTVATALAVYGGEAGVRIVDRDGVLHDAVESAFYGTIWADEVEKSLRALLANGGRRPPQGPSAAVQGVQPGTISVIAAGRSPEPQLPPTLRLNGVVQAVDAQAGTLIVAGKAAPAPLIVRVVPSTRIQRAGRLLTLAELKAKDTVGIEFPAAAWGGVAPSAVQVAWSKPWVPYVAVPCRVTAGAAVAETRAGGGGYAERGWIFHEAISLAGPVELAASRIEVAASAPAASLWLSGQVEAREGRRLLVRFALPPIGVGQRFWTEAQGKATPPPEIQAALGALGRWQALDEAGRRRAVFLDDSVRVSLDGVVITDLQNIPIGAAVSCAIPVPQAGEDPLRPEQVRASTPIATGSP